MEIPGKYNVYIDTIKKYYKDRDMSHDYAHVEQVCKNALYIYHNEGTIVHSETDELMLVISALGHDIWDHKYVTHDEINALKIEFTKDIISILNNSRSNEVGVKRSWVSPFYGPIRSWISPRGPPRSWLRKVPNSPSDCDILDSSIEIIDNISFSKEYVIRRQGKTLMVDTDIVFLRNIVSDADKLESLGGMCLKRMISYAQHTNTMEGLFDHIKDHCQNKLYKLLDDNYIITTVARNLALPRLKELREIVDDDDALRDFISYFSVALSV